MLRASMPRAADQSSTLVSALLPVPAALSASASRSAAVAPDEIGAGPTDLGPYAEPYG